MNGYRSIWDAGGDDTIDASDSSSSVVIDLRNATLKNEAGGGGFLSKINDETKGYTIAFDSLTLAGFGGDASEAVIENAIGSFLNDRLQGNEYANFLEGEDGNDTMLGGDGADTLYGGAGDDVYTGGDGGDTFAFDSGSNIINDFDPSSTGDNDDIAIDFDEMNPWVSITGDSLFIFDENSNASLQLVGAASLYKTESISDYDFIVSSSGFGDEEEVDDEVIDESNWIDHPGFESDYDFIERSKFASNIDIDDYYYSFQLEDEFTGRMSSPTVITFEADNGWLDVNGSYTSSAFTSDDHQYLAGTSTPYSSLSPAATGADGRTTLMPSTSGGSHSDGSAEGTIEYIHADGGAFNGNRIHFNLENIGHSGGPDEPDLARLNSGSNIDRGINMTFGTDLVAGGARDQFLEVLPSEQSEGGLKIHFSGTKAGSGDAFSNPVTAFGFYLMGREIKRDVYLDVWNTNGDLIYSQPTMEPDDLSQAVVEYIAFALDEQDEYPIDTIHLREEFDSEDNASRRDIFSIDNLVVQFGDELVSDEGEGDIEDEHGDGVDIFVGSGSNTEPFYTFYKDSAGSTPLDLLILDINETYSFKRVDGATSHPFFLSDKGKGQNSSRNINLSGDGSITTGITGDQTLELSFSDLATPFNTQNITGFCTTHSTMFAKFAVVGGDFSDLVIDELNNDALYRDEEGHVFILPENDSSNTPILITEQGRDYADGIFYVDEYGDREYMPAAITKTGSGYRMAIRDLWYGYDWETGEDKQFDEWVIADLSSSGVIDPESIRWNVNIASYEEEFNEDIDKNNDIGVTTSSLIELRSEEPAEFQQVGDKLFRDAQNSVYIIPDGKTTPILITEEGGYAAHLYEEWGEDDLKMAYAVVAQDDGYLLAVMHQYGGRVEWELINVSAQGQLDWSTAMWTQDISDREKLFGEDLNRDGSTGISTDDLTTVEADSTGDLLARNDQGQLFILQDGTEPLKLSDEWGGSVMFDNGHEDEYSSWSQEPYQVEFSEDDGKYYLAILEKWTNTYAGETYVDQQWVVYTVDADGSFKWDSAVWNANIANYEDIFKVDLDGDKNVGVNEDHIFKADTDTVGSELWKDSVTGSLFIVDEGGSKADRKQILDQGGWEPHLEWEDVWEGGSHSSTVVAVEKTKTGGYVLAIKHEDTFSDFNLTDDGDYPDPSDPTYPDLQGELTQKEDSNSMVFWEVLNLDSEARIDWSQVPVHTESIAGYENIFKQDLDGDGEKGVALGALTSIETDTIADQIKVSAAGTVHLWDGEDNPSVIDVVDENGATPSMVVSDSWGEYGSFNIVPYAVVKVDGGSLADDYYQLAVKIHDVYAYYGENNELTLEERIEWEIYKISLDGVIDSSETTRTFSIISWEPTFGQDMNGDGDKTGKVNITYRDTDSSGEEGVRIGEADGQLYIVNGSEQIAVQDPWIEDNASWDDGGYQSIALAAELNDNGTSVDTDDFYQLAVKQTNSWTDYWGDGELQTDVNWQVYAIDSAGRINWEKTIWTQSIAGFEDFFGEDLNGDNSTGTDPSTLDYAELDKSGYRLKKDQDKYLYIVDENGEIVISIKDEYGGFPSFDHSYNYWGGSHVSTAVAVEQNADLTFSLAVKHVDTQDGRSNVSWEVLNVSESGVLTWDDTQWMDDISLLETTLFKDDLDQDGSQGVNLDSLIVVESDLEVSTGRLFSNAEGDRYYIKDGGTTLGITHEWGGWIDLSGDEEWGDYSFTREPVAAEALSFTGSDGEAYDGYVVAVKNTFMDLSGTESVENINWEIEYVKPSGVVDEELRIHTNGIKGKEKLFAQDLDGDNAIGLDASQLVAVSTDSTGDLLKTLGQSLFIVNDKDTSTTDDDVVMEVVDAWGGTPWFDWQENWGYDDYIHQESVSAYAVESFEDSHGNTNFLLGIKISSQFGDEDPQTFWETFKIKEATPGESDWYLDWDSGSFSKGSRLLEAVLNQDLNGNGVVDSGSISTQNVATDTSSSGARGAALAIDDEGSLYIKRGTDNPILIEDENGPVAFDWSETWGGYTRTSSAFAVEGLLDDEETAIGSYKLAVKYEETNQVTKETSTFWETFIISTDGKLDWSSASWGAIKRHEGDLNEDLDGDGEIWSGANLLFTAVESDNVGSKLYVDPDNYLYVQPAGATTKSAVLTEFGDAYPATDSWGYSDITFTTSPVAVKDVTIGSGESAVSYYKLLFEDLKQEGSDHPVKEYWAVNVDQETMKVDWATEVPFFNYLTVEDQFQVDLDGDGVVYDPNNISTAAIATDTAGAKLRQASDGSLFIKDGEDASFAVTYADGSPVVVDIDDQLTDTLSISLKALAVQKSGDVYKLVVKETVVFESDEDVTYLVFDVTDAGVFDPDTVVYRTELELDETIWSQDVTGDGVVSQGSTSSASDTFADVVGGDVSQEVVDKFQNSSASDILSVKAADGTGDPLSVFAPTGFGATGNVDLTVKQIQSVDGPVLAKAVRDSGLSTSSKAGKASQASSDEYEAVTGVLDTRITVTNEAKFGKIQSISWVLPEDVGSDPTYLAKDPVSGEFSNLEYDSATGEGAQWDETDRTLTLYVRDNGKNDESDDLGTIRTPGFIAAKASKAVDNAATITGGTTGTGEEDGDPITGTLSATDAEGLTDTEYFSIESGDVPSNGTASINAETGVWSYTPTANFNGSDAFTVTVTDDAGGTTRQQIDLTVSAVDDAATITGGTTGTGKEDGDPITGTLSATDAEGLTDTEYFSIESGDVPSNGTASINAETGVWSYTPTANFNGSDAFTVTVTDDAGGTTRQQIDLTVSAVDDAATITGGTTGTGKEDGDPITGTLSATDAEGLTDTEYFSIESGDVPSNGTASINAETGVWSYTPTANFNGSDAFTVTVTDDAGGTTRQQIDLTVSAVDDAATITGGTTGTGKEDGDPITGTLSATDAEGLTDTEYFSIESGDVPSNGTASINAETGVWSYTPTANFNGSDAFTVTVTDDAGGTTRQQIDLTVSAVDDAATITGGTTGTGKEDGDPITGTLSATDAEGLTDTEYFSIESGDVPSNGTASINAETGVWSYTPTANFNGSDAFTVTVTDDAGGTTRQQIDLTVSAVDDAATITGGTTGTGKEDGDPITGTLSATDAEGLTDTEYFSIESGDVPSNGTASINAETGVWSYTPTANFNGSDAFTVTVTDDAGGTTRQQIDLTVSAVDDAATITGGTTGTGKEDGDPITGTLSATDAEGLTDTEYFSIESGDVPSNGTASINAETGVWSYTPTANFNGSDAFTVTVTDDAGGTTRQQIDLTVSAVDDAATITGGTTGTGKEDGDPITGTLSATDAEGLTDTEYFSIESGDVPSNGTASINAETGVWSYTPTANFNGSDAFTVTVTDDAGGTTRQQIDLTVSAVDDAATITGGTTGTGKEDGDPITGTLSATDAEGLTDTEYFSIESGDVPSNGTASINAETGVWSYTPTANFNGSDAFTVTVTDDAGGTTRQQIDLTVSAVDDAATITGGTTGTGKEDGDPITGTLSATDAEGLTDTEYFSIESGDVPSNGTASINAETGVWSYTPTANFNGSDAFTVTVTDDAGGTTRQQIDLTVSAVDDAATITGGTTGTGKEDGDPITGTLSATDAEGLTDTEYFSIESGDVPSNGTASINAETGVWSYTPTANFNGSDAFTVTVTDDAGGTTRQQIDLTVSAVDDAATITGGTTGTGKEDGDPITGTLSATDAEGLTDTEYFSIESGDVPSNGTASINAETGVWSYTPTANFNGSDAFTVTVTDDAGGTTRQQIDLTVSAVDDAATITGGTTGTGKEDGDPITGTLSATDAEGLTDTEYFSIESGDVPSNGTASINAETGVWSYTPTANFNGSDAFTVTVTDDAGGTTRQQIDLTVSAVDDAATITGGTTGTGKEDGDPITGTLSATDAEGLTDTEYFSIESGDVPSNGTASINAETGVWSYTPTANFNGSDAFTVTVTDDAGGTTRQQIDLTVSAVDDAATITGGTTGTGEEDGDPITGTLSATDAEGLTDTEYFSIESGDVPSNGTASINAETGVWSYTPTANFNGSDAFTVTVTDDAGGTTRQQIDLTIEPELPADVSDLAADDISSLTADAVSELTADQVNDLSPSAMQGFTSEQVAELSDDAVAALHPKQVKQLSSDAVAGLSKSQVSELTPKAVKGFTSEQMNQLSKKTFKGLETVQLAKLSKDAVTGLTRGQLKTLSVAEISAFKPGKIKSLDADAISGLKPKTLDGFSRRQVKALTDDQLAGLSNKQIKKADDFVDALSVQQREALSFDPRRSNRLIDPLDNVSDLLLPGVDLLA
ncbi:putative secreted protease domain protein [Synechococcus sp. RS9902]|nr:putative secreted protease domain protein [Synechococcus sp. RS9902]